MCNVTCVRNVCLRVFIYIHVLQLVDVGRLYQLIADVIMNFIKWKPQPFQSSLRSKEDFWLCKSYKRAWIWIFVIRLLLGYPSQRVWSKFTEDDYKLNVRSFRRWTRLERVIMARSPLFTTMQDTCFVRKVQRNKKERKRSAASSSEASPQKRRCVLADETTDEESDD